MSRKWTTLTVAALFSFGLAGISWADDDESPLAKLMEKVQAKNLVINKGVRTAVAYKKAQKDVTEAAAELAKLGKEARTDTSAVKKSDKTQADWERLMDAFIKESQDFAALTAKTETEQKDAKKAFSAVKASCTNCHNDFRVDE